MNLEEIMSQPSGAKFYRADLHIHSYGASHDVSDLTMTPEAIVNLAISENLHVISITDHNEIKNVPHALEASKNKEILVIPGVELSTPQGHLLAYFSTFDELQKFYSQLEIVDRDTANSRCQNSMLDCMTKAQAMKGFCILAHVDAPSGFDYSNPGNSPHKKDVICHPALLAIELKTADSQISYGDNDSEPDRAQVGNERITRLGLGNRQYLARTLFSDSHTLNALGRNASGDRKITRVKMAIPSFEALKIALEDSDARVRIENQIPDSIPHILGVSFSGGFLDNQHIQFSRNLNCIIGGRGTGKSTTFEAISCLATQTSESTILDSEVWPNELKLFWQDAADNRHSLIKMTGEPITNLDDSDFGPIEFAIDSYGQGAAARINERAQSNPLALLTYLDKFIELRQAIASEDVFREELLTLQTKIEESEIQVNLIPQYERLLSTTQQQIEALKQAKGVEVIELQQKLATERTLRDQIKDDWSELKSNIDGVSLTTGLKNLQALAKPDELTVGAQEFTAIVAGAQALEISAETFEKTFSTDSGVFEKILDEQLKSWRLKESEALKQIEEKRKELETKGIKLDMSYIQKLTKDEAGYTQSLANLKTWKPQLVELKKQRALALKNRWSARNRIALLRQAYGSKASATLQAVLTDLQVKLKFAESSFSPDGSTLIQNAMGWRTNQVPRIDYLVKDLTIPTLLTCIDEKNTKPITDLKLEDGTSPFNKSDAEDIIVKLSDAKVKFALERCEIHDLPRLIVTKKFAENADQPRFVSKDFSKLSLGQQQSILLSLLLSSDSTNPLIIDQPEDNLDGEFIYSSLVPVLRRAKERRQIIIVTHNANIAVLGDAEQIIVLKTRNDRSVITSRGSIDDPITRDSACSILEGAKEAFSRRAKIYGVI